MGGVSVRARLSGGAGMDGMSVGFITTLESMGMQEGRGVCEEAGRRERVDRTGSRL